MIRKRVKTSFSYFLAAWLSFLVLISATASAQSAIEEFQTVWSSAAASHQSRAESEETVGSSLYILYDGDVVGASHYGFEDIESGRPVDKDTIYHWASITKTFTAVAVLQLVERGLVTLDDPIVDYLPEVRQVHNPFGEVDKITLRHLLTHSSGFRGPTFPWGGSEHWHPHEPADWSQVAAMMPYTEIEFEPGSKFSYSNPGSSMLGRVVEIVTGDDIEVYLTKNILMPLGMTRSYFDHTPYYLLEDRSNNYFVKDGERTAQGLDFDTGATVGNGGLNAPVSDMAKWLNFWLDIKNDNDVYETVLPRQTLLGMWRPIHETTYDETVKQYMGMTFFIIDHAPEGDSEPRRYVGHTGGQKAFSSFVYVDPKSGAAAIFATNTANFSAPREKLLFGLTRKDVFESLLPALARQ